MKQKILVLFALALSNNGYTHEGSSLEKALMASVDAGDSRMSVTGKVVRELEEETRRQLELEHSRFVSVMNRRPSPGASDDNGWTDLHTAAAMNAVALARFLVEGGANVDAGLKDSSAHRQEVLTDDLQNLLRDLTGGEKFDGWDRRGATPLHVAAFINAREVAEYLV